MSAAASVDVQVCVTGTMPIPTAYAFRDGGNVVARTAGLLRSVLLPGGEMLHSPCLAYVIRHPDAGPILVDTGFHPDAARDRRKDFGTAMGFFFRSLEVADEPYTDWLRGRGVDPRAELRVLMTHLHVDHTSGMRLLPNATFTCTGEEWATAHARGAAGRGFLSHHLPPESRMELVDFAAAGQPHGAFERVIDLLGDGTVLLVSTPGHTAGHMSVLLPTASPAPVLLAGDAAYTLRSIREQRLPMLTAGDEDYARSLAQLSAFMEEQAGALVVPSHDPDAWRALQATAAPS